MKVELIKQHFGSELGFFVQEFMAHYHMRPDDWDELFNFTRHRHVLALFQEIDAVRMRGASGNG